ncbi:CU044_2847 family protein [Pseudarthrobacter sp. L19]|uniref:CU044_2847 family protein n=1 Tax=Pseudarthrobacter sp. L19 TaxID=3423951 RepID=UPI003D790ABA
MTEILRYEVGSGTVLVEVDEGSFGVERPARNEIGVLEAARRLEDALAAVRPAARAAAEVMRELAPEHLQLQFGVKLAGDAGAIIARNCAEGHFVVTLSFTAPAAPAVPDENEIVL